ncbi:hypothetical protein [Dyella sp. 20L07]|uniref:hypothetical protein n=1 Tax=Dyella sp. 20L07 TaxID=3384240 RepID=UPI003D28DB1C
MGQRIGELGRHAAIAVAYGIIYSLLKSLGFAHFVPLAGFKLAVVLLTPRRYWPALLVSETALLAYGLADCIEQYGWLFYFGAVFPPIALLMPIVLLCRTSMGGLTYPYFRLSSVLSCVLASSFVLVLDALLVASLIPNAVDLGRKPIEQLVADYFLGTYTGIVAVLPLLLTAAMEWHQERSFSAMLENNRNLLIAASAAALAVTAEVLMLNYASNVMLSFAGQAVLFIPAAYFSLKWGWKGAAIMGAIASFGIASLMPVKFDVGTLSSQSMMALFVTTFIVLGVQTTKLKRALSISDGHLRKARLEQHLYEVKLQRSSYELSFVNVELARAHRHLLLHLGYTHNRGEVDTHKDTLTKTTFRLTELANAIAPAMGASHPRAFTEGPISRLLDELGIQYQPNINGQLSALSKSSVALLYRLACEAVAFLLKEHPSEKLVLATHTETIQGKLTIRLTALSSGQRVPAPSAELVTKVLGTYDLGLEELRTRAQLFQGDVVLDGPCVQIILQQDLTGT